MKCTVILFEVLLLVLVAAVPAVAVPPIEKSGSWKNDGLLFTCETQGFNVFNYAIGQFSEKIYLDQQGAQVRVHGHETGVDTLHREGDFSKVLASKFSNTYLWDAITQETKYTGSVFNTNLPQEGILFKASGQAVFDGQTGELRKRVGADYLDLDAVCAYLAP